MNRETELLIGRLTWNRWRAERDGRAAEARALRFALALVEKYLLGERGEVPNLDNRAAWE